MDKCKQRQQVWHREQGTDSTLVNSISIIFYKHTGEGIRKKTKAFSNEIFWSVLLRTKLICSETSIQIQTGYNLSDV